MLSTEHFLALAGVIAGSFTAIVISLAFMIVFRRSLSNKIDKTENIEIEDDKINIKMSSIETVEQTVNSITQDAREQFDRKASQLIDDGHKLNPAQVVRASWRPIEQIVKEMALLHLDDYKPSHKTLSAAARLRDNKAINEQEMRAVIELRHFVYDVDNPPSKDFKVDIDISNRYYNSAEETFKALNARLDAYRSNGGEEKYQNMLRDNFSGVVINFSKRGVD